MKRLALALLASMLCVASAGAQNVPPGTNPIPAAGAYNSSPPTCTAGQFCMLQTDINGQLKIVGSISASLSGFPTTQTTGTPISVTTGGVTGTLPAGVVVVASNVGATNGAYCKLGASATTSDQLIPPNSWFAFTVGASTQLTCITSTSTTTVNMVGGSGLPTGSGGGGSSSGGGAITVADGADVTQGAKADAACAGGGSTCSVNARLAHIETLGAAPLPAQTGIGNANIGAVQNAGSKYIAVAAGATATILQSSTGAAGDYLSHCVIYPTSTSPGVVTVFDNTNTAANSAILFAGGSTSTSNLTPISVPVGALSVAGAWKVTTGTAVSVVCFGKFS